MLKMTILKPMLLKIFLMSPIHWKLQLSKREKDSCLLVTRLTACKPMPKLADNKRKHLQLSRSATKRDKLLIKKVRQHHQVHQQLDTNKCINNLTPTSASTTTTINNTNSVNANNSEINTSSNLIPSSIDEERKESEKCGNAGKQDVKEKMPVLNSGQWNKGTSLIVEDLMLAGLRETKLSRSKRIQVRYFPGGKTEDLQYHQIRYPKKEPNNIIIHIRTNYSPYKTEDFAYKEMVNAKETITKFHPNCKNIFISSLIV